MTTCCAARRNAARAGRSRSRGSQASAREQLADPAQSGVPVHPVAVRAGFEHHSVFTRAFRSAYGMSPRDHRRRALLREAGAAPAGD
ncbi:helix-turn-helix domain-containing protein [Streptomyces eurythermus]|uniref:helix-turn-helix domain-containing protein n=1 Tax=Streptomyces eurythermus TaxID=42237 RepID=UPI0036D28992